MTDEEIRTIAIQNAAIIWASDKSRGTVFGIADLIVEYIKGNNNVA